MPASRRARAMEPPTAYLGVHAPDPRLASLVLGYWVIADLAGAHRSTPVHTAPHPAAIVTINVGRPCVGELPAGAPRLSLLGVQTSSRCWRSAEDVYFAMVLLTLPGIARLFPRTGAASADNQLELGGVLGDRDAHALERELAAAVTPARMCAVLDGWLLARIAATRPASEQARFARTCEVLARGGRVDDAARAVGVSARQLERDFAAHVGLSPKTVAGLHRVHASLRAVQTRAGDPRAGFADQPHQVRAWRRHLATTPGAYAPSAMANVTARGVAHFL